MKCMKMLLLAGIMLSLMMQSASVYAKAQHPLAKATDPKKIQELIRSTNYKKVTEGDFVAVRKHLGSLVKAVDISNDDGRMKAGILYMAIVNFTQYTKNPSGNRDHVTQGWQDMKASDFAKSLKDIKQADFIRSLDEKYSSDDAKLREEYKNAKTAK